MEPAEICFRRISPFNIRGCGYCLPFYSAFRQARQWHLQQFIIY